jgi:hypothetical protein
MKTMPSYTVTFPITGKIGIEVEADDEESAIEKAWDETTIDDIFEWEPIRSEADVECCDDTAAEVSNE